MEGSIERVRTLLRGEMPDRAPLFDLLRNDAVINHFTGETLTVENAPDVVHKTYPTAIDATRSVRLPDNEETVTLPDGRTQKLYRWTAWTQHVRYESTAAYVAAKTELVDSYDPGWSATVDGRPVSLRRTNHALLGLDIPAGKHRVDLSFTPSAWKLGIYISLASLVVVAGLAVASARTRAA